MYRLLTFCLLIFALTPLSCANYKTASGSITAMEQSRVGKGVDQAKSVLEQRLHTARADKNQQDELEILFELGEENIKNKAYSMALSYFRAMVKIVESQAGSVFLGEGDDGVYELACLRERVGDCLYHS